MEYCTWGDVGHRRQWCMLQTLQVCDGKRLVCFPVAQQAPLQVCRPVQYPPAGQLSASSTWLVVRSARRSMHADGPKWQFSVLYHRLDQDDASGEEAVSRGMQ